MKPDDQIADNVWPTTAPMLTARQPATAIGRSGQTIGRAIARPRPSLIGRELQVTAILNLMADDDVQLVTLTGPGGIGKTQLALEVASRIESQFDGAWFVDLSPVRDPEVVPGVIAQALGLRDFGGIAPLDQLVEFLAARQALLVLDNFEQVVSASLGIATLIAGCPQLTVLVTSRVPLHLSGERRYPVPPLPVPDPAARDTFPQIRTQAAVHLFIRTAQLVEPGFELTDENAGAVAAICARLDGLPLAIELAAARSNILSPAALLARLDHALPLLADGPRDAPPRLRSMRDAIGWSYGLLDESDQRLFRHLAIFTGGFTENAARAVARDADDETMSMLDRLTGLVENSLLVVTGTGESPRFSMLETIREFGQEQLGRLEELGFVEEGRRRWLLDLVQDPEPLWESAQYERWHNALQPEYDNLRATLEWLTRTGDRAGLVHMVSRVRRFWMATSQWEEGASWLDLACAWSEGEHSRERMDILTGAGSFSLWMGNEPTATALLEQALALAQELEPAAAFDVHVSLGIAAMIRGDFDQATAHHDQALAVLDAISNTGSRAIEEGRSIIYGNQGYVELSRGDIERAGMLATKALQIQRAVNFEPALPATLRLAAEVAIARGNALEANQLIKESLHRGRTYFDFQHLASVFTILSAIDRDGGQLDRAARLLGAVDRIRTTLGGYPADRLPLLEQLAREVRQSLGEQAYTETWATGRAMSLEEAIALALQVEIVPSSSVMPPGIVRFGITARERDVLCLLAEGRTDQEIADALFLSRRTVNTHVGRLLAKLGVPNRRQAIASAREQELLSDCPGIGIQPQP